MDLIYQVIRIEILKIATLREKEPKLFVSFYAVTCCFTRSTIAVL